MSLLDTRWGRVRRSLGPLTRRVPYGHVLSETVTYARLLAPGNAKPDRRFVVFAQGRSGSTLLTELLNSHPQVYCADEILTWKRRDPVRYASACSVGHRVDTYGFKVKIYQLKDAQGMEDPGAFLRRLHEQNWRIVHLQRRNVLRQALSSMVAEQRRIYHEPAGSNDSLPVRVDAVELLRRSDERTRFCVEEARALAALPHLRLTYETDLLRADDHARSAGAVFRFLGLSEVPVTTRTRKIGDKSLSQLLDNAEEVEVAVRGSAYAGLLDEP